MRLTGLWCLEGCEHIYLALCYPEDRNQIAITMVGQCIFTWKLSAELTTVRSPPMSVTVSATEANRH